MNSKDKLLEATLNVLQENVYDEPLYGKDVLYVFEDFDTGVDKNQEMLIKFANDYLDLNLNPVKDDLKIAKEIQLQSGDTVFYMIRQCYGDEIADKFDEFFDISIETLDTSKIKYIQ